MKLQSFSRSCVVFLGVLILMPLQVNAIVLEPGPVVGPEGSTTTPGSSNLGAQVSKNTSKALKTFNGVSSKKFLKGDDDFLDLNESDNQTKFKVEES